MQTNNQRFPLPPAQFTFAGFTWPRTVAVLPKGTLRERLAKAKEPRNTGPYYHAPDPLLNRDKAIRRGFYLGDHGMPGLRWEWCDEVDPVTIHHTGWFINEHGGGDKIRGIVFRLPKGRGFLPGWAMGWHMAGGLEYDMHPHLETIAAAADLYAEEVADEQRGYEMENQDEEEPVDHSDPYQTISEMRETIETLRMDLRQAQSEHDSTRRLCSQFEDQVGSLQIANGRLRDEIARLRRR